MAKHPSTTRTLRCEGCRADFESGADFLHHMESGNCTTVSASDFLDHLLHEFFVDTISKRPAFEAFMRKLSMPTAQIDSDAGGGATPSGTLYHFLGERVDDSSSTDILDIHEAPVAHISHTPASVEPHDPQVIVEENFVSLESDASIGANAMHTLSVEGLTPDDVVVADLVATRFWDFQCAAWNPGVLYDPAKQCYYCPFPCA